MKRILFFSTDNTIESGAFKSMSKLCSLLKASGNYYPIVILPNHGDGYTLLDEYGIEHYYIRSCRWIVNQSKRKNVVSKLSKIVKECINFISFPRLLHLAKKLDVDAVHVNTLHAYVGAKVANKIKVPLIWHFRELLDEDQGGWFWDNSYFKLLNSANSCIAISEYVHNRFKDIVNPKKLIVIPNGIDETEYYSKREFISHDILRIVCVGKINGHKGHETIIKACNLLLNRNLTGFKVTFVGNGGKEQEYKQLCTENKLDNYISFKGKQTNVKQYYEQSDVMIMGSDAEAFGRTTVEAMMSGCAIIGANSGATPELLDHGKYGFIFNKGDYSELADILQQIIQHPQIVIDMAIEGQKYAISKYTAKHNAEMVMQMYERLGI